MPRPMQRTSKIGVSNLDYSTTEQLLKETFEKHGNITEAVIMRDSDTQRSRGFGYVVFEVKEEAWNAAYALDQETLGRKTIFCKIGEEEAPYEGGYKPPN